MKYAILLLAVVVLVAGCTQQASNNNTTPNRTEYLPPEGYPALRIVTPADGEVIHASTIGVKINVTNFRLAGIANQPNVQNEGHISSAIDGISKMGSLPTFAFDNVAPGVHVIRVELLSNDNLPLYPPVSASVTVTVAP